MRRLALPGLFACLTACDVVFGLSRAKPDGGTSDAKAADCSDPSLRLCMLFEDELIGQADDGSSQSNHATVTNVVSVVRGDEQAVQRSTTSQIVIAEDTSLDLQQPATISTWFFIDTAPLSGTGVILLDNDSQYAIAIDDRSGVDCNAQLSNGLINIRQTITLGLWHHVACVYEQGADASLTMYLDGNDVGASHGLGTMVTGGSSGVHLGENGGSGGLESTPLTGMLDNVRIWARALTAAEIKTLAATD